MVNMPHNEDAGDRAVTVLHLINGQFYSGVEHVVITLAKNCRNIETRIVCLLDGDMALSAPQDIPVNVLPMKNRLDFRAITRLIHYVRVHKIDIIHAHTLRANLIGALVGRLTATPIMVSIHSPRSCNKIACYKALQEYYSTIYKGVF